MAVTTLNSSLVEFEQTTLLLPHQSHVDTITQNEILLLLDPVSENHHKTIVFAFFFSAAESNEGTGYPRSSWGWVYRMV